MKTCSKCGESKDVELFSRAARYAGGRRSQCKECIKGANRAWQEANADRVREYQRAYHKRNREEILSRKRGRDDSDRAARYYAENRERIRRQQKERYDLDREGSPLSVRAHYVYCLFDEAGSILYVGITVDPKRRLAEHRRSKPWFGQVDHNSIEPYPDRMSALREEARIIREYRPTFNLAGKENTE